MSTEFEKLKNDLLALPPQSRASLAHALIASLDEVVDQDVDKLWEEEIRPRHQEIKDGSVVLKSADEVLRDARERLQCLK